ncbi:hypothetical protein [Vibrio paucivorans]|uniref:Uncharacterized protein n=1 Tax=Vibrio paucivorans TaxID=2829489 RepID=A0A9X3HRF2_9VIBR|nr:hypothetical protein [Vibrio paucivorans]MCW8333896.1 hypothetical protein [Vibrio paucivorans]
MVGLAILLVRAVALFVTLSSIYAFVPALALSSFWQQASNLVLFSLVGHLFLPVLLSSIIWYFSDSIAAKLFKEEADEGTAMDIRDEHIVTVGCFLIGVYLLITGLATFIGFWISSNMINYPALLKAVMAFGLIMGSRGVRKLYCKIRS